MNQYTINGKIISWESLIKKACEYDEGYKSSIVKTTTRAAEILRAEGFKIEVPNTEVTEDSEG